MRTPLFLGLAGLLATGLTACEKTPAPPAASAPAPAAVRATASVAAPDDEADPMPLAENLSVAIDEPLPPFEEDSGIQLVSESRWRALDAAMPVSGAVAVYEAPDGSRLLRLENLRAPQDVRIDLALSRQPEPQSVKDLAEGLSVGPLKGPSGNMNYLLADAIDFAAVRAFVLIDRQRQAVLASAPVSKPQ